MRGNETDETRTANSMVALSAATCHTNGTTDRALPDTGTYVPYCTHSANRSLCRAPASQVTLPVHSGVGLQARIACKQNVRVTSSTTTARGDPLHLPASYCVLRTKKNLLLSSLWVWTCCSCRERTSSRGSQCDHCSQRDCHCC